MQHVERIKIEMAKTVRDFCKANPSDDPGYATALGRLEDRLARFDALALRQSAARSAEGAAVDRRNQLRRDHHFQLVRHVVRAGQLAAREQPQLLRKFKLGPLGGTHTAFLVSARRTLEEAVANQEALVAQGLSLQMLEELKQRLAEYEQAMGEVHVGRTAHMGARTDLEVVAAEVVRQVELLNTFNQRRFRNDPERLGAWEGARTRRPRERRIGRKPVPPGDATPTGDASSVA